MQKIVDVPGATIWLLFSTPQHHLTLPTSQTRGLAEGSLTSPEASSCRLHTAAEVGEQVEKVVLELQEKKRIGWSVVVGCVDPTLDNLAGGGVCVCWC